MSRLTITSPRNKSSAKEVVKKMSLPKMPTGHEAATELLNEKEFYQKCKILMVLRSDKLYRKGILTDAEKVVFANQQAFIQETVKTLLKIDEFLAQRQESKDKFRTHLSEAQQTAEILANKAARREMKQEVEAIIKHLNDPGEPRKAELAERLIDINLLIAGMPSRDSGKVASIATTILEMWRTAGSTSITDCGSQLQFIRNDTHDRFAAVDAVDIALRFQTLFDLFQKHSLDTSRKVTSSGWTSQECEKWAAACDKERLFNPLMTRFLRSASQALFTGNLPKKEVLERAPNLPDTTNKLFATITAGGQLIFRTFHADLSSELKLILPFEMKKRDTELFAKIVVDYTIVFDKEMNAVSLRCKATPPINPKRAV